MNLLRGKKKIARESFYFSFASKLSRRLIKVRVDYPVEFLSERRLELVNSINVKAVDARRDPAQRGVQSTRTRG